MSVSPTLHIGFTPDIIIRVIKIVVLLPERGFDITAILFPLICILEQIARYCVLFSFIHKGERSNTWNCYEEGYVPSSKQRRHLCQVHLEIIQRATLKEFLPKYSLPVLI